MMASAQPRKLQIIKSMLMSLTDLTNNQINQILKDYGCFCYVGGQKTTGNLHNIYNSAKPVDQLDQICHDLFKAKQCLDIDYRHLQEANSTQACDADSGYKWYTKNIDNRVEIVCGNRENHDRMSACKRSLCEMEREFVYKIKDLLIEQNYQKDPRFYRMSEEDYHQTCMRSVTSDKYSEDPLLQLGKELAQISCCGAGLNRRSYNGLSRDCCPDGQIKNIGLCPSRM